MNPVELPPGTVVDGRYEVLEELGRGGMAVVYHVRDARLGSDAALKVLRVPADAVRERLLQEGRIQARLKHPNVVSVTDIVSIGHAPGLVMEFVDGATLEDLIYTHPPTPAQAQHLGQAIIDGVIAAHEMGTVHRDLKPANILLAVVDTRLVPKITDFGLAKVLDDPDASQRNGATRSGSAMGTPCYIAPEQILDAKSVDQRADIFSLGAILYEMLVHTRAFDGPNILEILNRVASAQYVPLRALAPDLPDHLVDTVEACLQVDRNARPESARVVARMWAAGVGDPVFGNAVVSTLKRIAREGAPVPTPDEPELDSVDSESPTEGGVPRPRSVETADDAVVDPDVATRPFVRQTHGLEPLDDALGSELTLPEPAIAAPVDPPAAEQVDRGPWQGVVVGLLVMGLVAFLVGVGGVGGLGVVSWLYGNAGEPVPEAVPFAGPASPEPTAPDERDDPVAVEPIAPPAPAPPVSVRPTPPPPRPVSPEPATPAPVPPEPAAPVPSPGPRPAPSLPGPVAPPRPVPSPPPSEGRAPVDVRGVGLESIRFVRADGRVFGPGAGLSPGRYRVETSWTSGLPNSDAVPGGLVVSDSTPIVLQCQWGACSRQ